MSTKEGIVKYQCEYTPGPALPVAHISEMNAWRKLMVISDFNGQ